MAIVPRLRRCPETDTPPHATPVRGACPAGGRTTAARAHMKDRASRGMFQRPCQTPSQPGRLSTGAGHKTGKTTVGELGVGDCLTRYWSVARMQLIKLE